MQIQSKSKKDKLYSTLNLTTKFGESLSNLKKGPHYSGGGGTGEKSGGKLRPDNSSISASVAAAGLNSSMTKEQL